MGPSNQSGVIKRACLGHGSHLELSLNSVSVTSELDGRR